MRITSLNELIEEGKKRKGDWRLAKNGDLQYRSSGKDEQIRLKAVPIAAEPDALVLSLTEKRSDQKAVTHLARLSGTWKTDARNRLAFEVERESGKRDELTFEGGWELDGNQKLVYRLKQTSLKTRRRMSHAFTFSGDWKVTAKDRLAYTLSGDGSALRLRGAFETVTGPKAGRIRFQLGSQAVRTPRKTSLEFFGQWSLTRKGERLALELSTRTGRDLGMELLFTKDLLGGGLFVRLKKGLEESRAEAGVSVRW